jgi:mevalonate kinase
VTRAASGKLILLGEHAVVYGAPALVMSIDRGLRADVTEAADPPGTLSVLDRQWSLNELGDLPAAVRALFHVMAVSTPLDVIVTGSLPPGVGLGFSACAGVAVARAVNEWRDRPVEERVMEAAMAWEGIFHGNPSGVDVAACITKGCFRFTKKDGVRSLVASRGLSLCIGLTGEVSATRDMVASVARLGERQPDLVRRNVEAIASLVENGIGGSHGVEH